MNKDSIGRADFASKVGMILATAGSAVGLGNIWRFPVTTGNNGGAAFILIYILCVIILGVPLMTSEFVVGRQAHSNTAEAFRKLGKGALWKNVGVFGVITGWFILCYYIVVSGWTLSYLVEAVRGTFTQLARSGEGKAYEELFTGFVTDPYLPVIYMAVFMLMSHYVIVRGVKNGIERFSKILMPMLFILLLLLMVCSLFTSGAQEGLTFLLQPDFSKITFRTVLEAMGQAFYSLSIAMGCICTYASYFGRDVRLVNTAFKVSTIDTLIAIMAGVIIFPAVFSTGIRPDAGASLVFIALPGVFQQAFSGIPMLSYVVSVMFYFLLVLATLTSVISLQEVVTAWLSEDFKLGRGRAATVVTVTCIVVGSLCSLSMGPLAHLKIMGRSMFDFFDFFSGQLMLPIGGFFTALFVGWKLERTLLWQQLACGQPHETHLLARILICLLRYFVPLAILMIFLSGLGVMQVIGL
ncbi:MAG: sodium-dependent transporter [Bacteroidaceae bacterium]|nr:sodium-dependent transporter [Bacteroidaceae bacterium]